MSDPAEVLDYWLGELGEAGWYAGTEAIDAAIRARFEPLWRAAASEGLGHWVSGPGPALAFLVLTDQFPRNMFRGRPEAFATDAMARDAARKALAAGWDLGAPEPERQFFYLPFEHSEDLADQELCVALMAERLPASPDNLLHARAHREIIRRFGRFPTRNAALGRETTAPEAEMLAQGGYGAVVEALKASAMR